MRKMMMNSFTHQVGYDLRLLGDGLKIDEKFLCSLCSRILRNPVQIYCGHRLCKDCFQYCQSTDDKICPGSEKDRGENCDRAFEQSFPDNAIKREMAPMKARCYFDGCSWIGSFKEFEVNHYGACEFRTTECPVCHKALPRSQTNDVTRNVECCLEHMQCVFSRLKKLNEIIGCTDDDLVRATTARPILERISLIEQTVEQLTTQLTIGINSTPVNKSTKRLTTAQGANEQVAENVAASLQRSEEKDPVGSLSSDKMKIIEDVLAVLNREVEKLTGDLESMERQRKLERDLMETMDRKVKSVERMVALKDVTIAELGQRMTEMEQTSYDGTMLWKITDFNRRRQEAIAGGTTSFYSPSFYTSRTGYKMCARIYLNGDGMGKGSHVSLFFVVMRGHYDALLKWPFRHKVSMTFVDQNNREHVTESIQLDPTSPSFRRPTIDINIPIGYPEFMSISQLDSGPLNAYVKDNVAFVKITVNVED